MSEPKTCIITGGAKRIGAAIGRHFHAQGYQLLIHYRSTEDAAIALQQELNSARPGSVHLMQGELREMSLAKELIDTCLNEFGRLDSLINNASAFFPTPVDAATETDWDLLMQVNLKAPFFLCQQAAPALRESQGSIVNLIDIYAERPLADHPIYTASKAGLASLTHSLARDLAPAIRVNGVAPGAILWPEAQQDEAAQQALLARTPLQRLGSPSDIAQTAYFLTEQAPYITGQIIKVDGGRSVMP